MIFERIVCGVDGSPEGFEALRQAATLRTAEAGLLSVTACESHLPALTGAGAGQLGQKLRDEAGRTRDLALASLRGVPFGDARIVEGKPLQSLLTVLERESATLAVVGSHGGGRLTGVLFGSVATAILQQAACSVLVARSSTDSVWYPRSVVVGMDGSPEALASAAVAAEIADRFGADVRTIAAQGGDQIDRRMLDGLDELEWVSTHPVDALVDASAEADLVVVGSRGLRALKALGSVSERVAHRARCSVLVTRP
jgi:nucleotide-binding universal stress UspA family protein